MTLCQLSHFRHGNPAFLLFKSNRFLFGSFHEEISFGWQKIQYVLQVMRKTRTQQERLNTVVVFLSLKRERERERPAHGKKIARRTLSRELLFEVLVRSSYAASDRP